MFEQQRAARVPAMSAGQPLRELLKSKEYDFDQRFATTFGQLTSQDLPPGEVA